MSITIHIQKEPLFPNSYVEGDKKRNQIISIYGCNPSPPEGKMSFFVSHQISDKAWTTDDAYVVDTVAGDKRSSVFGL